MIQNIRSALVMSLQKHQKESGFISDEVQKRLARQYRLTQADVKGVISFYAFLTEKPTGKYTIRTCATICCSMAGGENIYEYLKKRLDVDSEGLSACKRFTLEKANCMGMCDQAPALLLNNQAIGRLDERKIEQLLNDLSGDICDD